ncbi:MAG: hypothetical protein MMC23_005876 [Stictis urceolatum]|nr:hypothetical protein [Stictis urceolata]
MLAPKIAVMLPFLLVATPVLAAVQRGLAYNDANLANLFTSEPSLTWGYNWGYPSGGLDSKYEFVPMLWGNPTSNPSYEANWANNVTAAKASGSSHLLAFNEPDINNLSPADAATAYLTYMNPYASQGFKLGAPAVTNGGPPTGLTWLEQFLGNCTQCTIDFVPIHWYASWDQSNYFATYVQQAYAAGGNRPIWITEFEGGFKDTDAHQVSFIHTVLPWLDAQSYVERYAYNMAGEGFMINDAGTALSAIGTAFAETSGVNATMPTTNVP